MFLSEIVTGLDAKEFDLVMKSKLWKLSYLLQIGLDKSKNALGMSQILILRQYL